MATRKKDFQIFCNNFDMLYDKIVNSNFGGDILVISNKDAIKENFIFFKRIAEKCKIEFLKEDYFENLTELEKEKFGLVIVLSYENFVVNILEQLKNEDINICVILNDKLTERIYKFKPQLLCFDCNFKFIRNCEIERLNLFYLEILNNLNSVLFKNDKKMKIIKFEESKNIDNLSLILDKTLKENLNDFCAELEEKISLLFNLKNSLLKETLCLKFLVELCSVLFSKFNKNLCKINPEFYLENNLNQDNLFFDYQKFILENLSQNFKTFFDINLKVAELEFEKIISKNFEEYYNIKNSTMQLEFNNKIKKLLSLLNNYSVLKIIYAWEII